MKKDTIKNIWKNKKAILEGLKNNMFKTDHVEKIHDERLEICKGCPFYDPEGKSEKAVLKGKPSCASCGCPMATKLRSLTTDCPEGFWSHITDSELADKIEKQIHDNL